MPSIASTLGAGPKRALVLVDVQKDFMPDYGGPLPALGDGPSLISGINSLLSSDFFAAKVGIKDMHPPVRGRRVSDVDRPCRALP